MCPEMVPTRRLRRRMNGNASDFQHVKNPLGAPPPFSAPLPRATPPPLPGHTSPVAGRSASSFCCGRYPWTFFAAISVSRPAHLPRPARLQRDPGARHELHDWSNGMCGAVDLRRRRRSVRAARDAVRGPFLEGSQTRARESSSSAHRAQPPPPPP